MSVIAEKQMVRPLHRKYFTFTDNVRYTMTGNLAENLGSSVVNEPIDITGRAGHEITLHWGDQGKSTITNSGLYALSYLIFSYNSVGTRTGTIPDNGAVELNVTVMSTHKKTFWLYDETTKEYLAFGEDIDPRISPHESEAPI